MNTDVEGERDLCGSFDDDELREYENLMREEDSMEDGEVATEESEDEEDPEVVACMQSGNLDKLKKILKRREDECVKLKKEVEKTRLKEKQNKEMQAVLDKINKVSKTRKSLQKSISASRQASPAASPQGSRRPTKGKVQKTKQTASTSKETNKATDRSEYEQIFSSFMKLKQGSPKYADLVANALSATDQVIALSEGTCTNDKIAVKQSKHKPKTELATGPKIEKSKAKVASKEGGNKPRDKVNVDEMLNLIEKFKSEKGVNANRPGEQVAQALLEALTSINVNKDTIEVNSPIEETTQHSEPKSIKAIEVLESISHCLNGSNNNNKGSKDNELPAGDNNGTLQGPGGSEGSRKLVSGKCTKPDESDIKKVVKYPHEKLDSKHVTNRDFDKLEFNILIAGELELIALHSIGEQEKAARIEVAKVLCYHKKYLDDANLRAGYDSIMKQVEQGVIDWDDSLGEKLHQLLDYRANVILRDKMNNEGFTKVEYKKPTERKSSTFSADSGNKEKVFYCLEFNLGTCPQTDHHEGRLGSKKVTKFHICRRCHKDGEFKSHADGDDCPKKHL